MLSIIRSELSAFSTGPGDLRKFGILMAAVLSVICGVILWKRGLPPTNAAWIVGGAGVTFLVLGATLPRMLRPVYLAWMTIAIVLGFVMTRVILTAVFFLVITPIGIVMRVLGKDPLTKGPDASLPTYWIPKVYRTRDPERLRKYY